MAKIVYDPNFLPQTMPGYRANDGFWNVYIRRGIAPNVVDVVSPEGKHIGTAKLTKNHEDEYGKRAKGLFEYKINLFTK